MKFSIPRRFSQAVLSVRSALMQCTLVAVLRVGGAGSMMSVKTREAIVVSERRAVARAWPRKPPAPVMRIFAILRIFGEDIKHAG